VPVVIPSIALYLAVGTIFWIESRRQETLADRMLAISFFAWAALRLTIFLVLNGGTAGLDLLGVLVLGEVAGGLMELLIRGWVGGGGTRSDVDGDGDVRRGKAWD